jgi:hypothetical protein
MMSRRTIGWVVAIALGASGTALAQSQSTRSQTQRTTTTQPQQSGQQSQQQPDQERTIEQQTRETTVGAPPAKEPQAADVSPSGSADEPGFMTEQTRPSAMTLEDRLEAIRLKALEKEEAMDVQTKLQELGYYKGKLDGIVGPQTRAGLQRYFRDQAALASRGMVGSAALAALGIDESVIERVRGRDQASEGETQGTMPSPSTPPDKTQSSPSPGHQHMPGTEQSGTR